MKALFFDIDGTLLSEKTHQVPESAIRAIEEARKNGCLSFINSGRCECMLKQMERILPMDGILAGCGTELTYQRKRIFYYSMPDELQQRVVHADRIYNIGVVAEGSECNHYRPEVSRMEVMNYMKAQTEKLYAVSTADFEGHYEISKFCVQADEESDIEGFIRDFSDDFDIMDRRGGFYECVPKGYDKGQAILHMAELLGIKRNDIYVFGDSSNDLAMFKIAPEHSTVMKKHDPVLDPYAAYVTDKVEEHGIAKALKHWRLIR